MRRVTSPPLSEMYLLADGAFYPSTLEPPIPGAAPYGYSPPVEMIEPKVARAGSRSTKVRAQHVIVHEKVDYAWNLAANGAQTITVEKYVDTLGWVSGVIVVRVHSATLGTATVSFVFQAVSFAPDEPNTVFAGANLSRSLSITSGTTPPTALFQALDNSAMARYGRAQITINQGASATATSLTCSIELIGRDA